jgi:hypothetical protein
VDAVVGEPLAGEVTDDPELRLVALPGPVDPEALGQHLSVIGVGAGFGKVRPWLSGSGPPPGGRWVVRFAEGRDEPGRGLREGGDRAGFLLPVVEAPAPVAGAGSDNEAPGGLDVDVGIGLEARELADLLVLPLQAGRQAVEQLIVVRLGVAGVDPGRGRQGAVNGLQVVQMGVPSWAVHVQDEQPNGMDADLRVVELPPPGPDRGRVGGGEVVILLAVVPLEAGSLPILLAG